MNAKSGKRRSAGGIQVLNDERITPAQTANVNLNKMLANAKSPKKQINLNMAKKKVLNKTPKQEEMEHYTLHIQNIKGEKNIENGHSSDHDIIDFVYKDIKKEKDGNVKKNTNAASAAVVLNEHGEEITMTIDDDDDEGEFITPDNEGDEVNGSSAGIRDFDVEHVCGKCYKTFRRFSGLKKHMDFCRFDSDYHLRKAQMLKNLEKIEKDAIIMENKDICFCCGESYDTFHLGHINCPDCPKSFKTQTSYERHIFITHSEGNKYPCTICNASMRSANLLKLHIEQHQNRGKPFACKVCGKDFTRAYHLKRHQKFSSCGASENESMSCKVCNKLFYRLDNLRTHLKTHLGTQNGKKPEYMCPVCKNCFYSLSTLNIHTRTHTGERPFDCDLCDKKFPSLVALKKHRRYHTGEKPYTCAVCNTSFAVKEVLNRHMKRHTGERPHRCDVCGKGFIQATQLRMHSKTHIKNFQCETCDERFKTEKGLLRHAKGHFRRPKSTQWKCTQCKASFKSTEELAAHLAEGDHTARRRNRRSIIERTDCAICDKNFDSAKTLYFHMVKVHEADPEEILGTKPLKKKLKPAIEVLSTEIISPPKQIKMDTAAAVVNNNNTSNVTPVRPDTDGGLVVQEYIINEMPSSKKCIVLNNIESYTVIPLEQEESDDGATTEMEIPNASNDEIANETKNFNTTKKKSLAESLAAAISLDIDEEDMLEVMPNLTEEDLKLKNNVAKLLDMLVDSFTLKKFGWPKQNEESVLCQVIENCGHDLSKDENIRYKDSDYATRMREYVKLLFTVVIHNNSIKELLNNYSIDEVIEYVLGNGDDDDDDDVDNEEENEDNKDNISVKHANL